MSNPVRIVACCANAMHYEYQSAGGCRVDVPSNIRDMCYCCQPQHALLSMFALWLFAVPALSLYV
jgi:hypothetical protein